MPDMFDSATRSWIMSRVHGRNTSEELAVRRALHAAGYRFRLHRSDLPGKPDVVLPKFRVALFVHGCFWHGHNCKRARVPESNRDYWTEKIRRNMERDERVREALTKMGWRTYIIWTCDIAGGVSRLLEFLAASRQV